MVREEWNMFILSALIGFGLCWIIYFIADKFSPGMSDNIICNKCAVEKFGKYRPRKNEQ